MNCCWEFKNSEKQLSLESLYLSKGAEGVQLICVCANRNQPISQAKGQGIENSGGRKSAECDVLLFGELIKLSALYFFVCIHSKKFQPGADRGEKKKC